MEQRAAVPFSIFEKDPLVMTDKVTQPFSGILANETTEADVVGWNHEFVRNAHDGDNLVRVTITLDGQVLSGLVRKTDRLPDFKRVVGHGTSPSVLRLLFLRSFTGCKCERNAATADAVDVADSAAALRTVVMLNFPASLSVKSLHLLDGCAYLCHVTLDRISYFDGAARLKSFLELVLNLFTHMGLHCTSLYFFGCKTLLV
jgi:hypothetical protein